jgi:hypothetical protein
MLTVAATRSRATSRYTLRILTYADACLRLLDSGGNALESYEQMYSAGRVSSSCMPYAGKDVSAGGPLCRYLKEKNYCSH